MVTSASHALFDVLSVASSGWQLIVVGDVICADGVNRNFRWAALIENVAITGSVKSPAVPMRNLIVALSVVPDLEIKISKSKGKPLNKNAAGISADFKIWSIPESSESDGV